MSKTECYNFDWLVDWLKRNIEPNLIPQLMVQAKYIALNFSNCYFFVTEENVVEAMQELGYPCIIKNEQKCFNASLSEQAKSEFAKHWN